MKALVIDDDVKVQDFVCTVGRSHAFIEVMKQVSRVAPTNLPVLLTGESGTGKELIASTLHRRGGRGDKRFVSVNCAAIPADLIESELFGYCEGLCIGAEKDRGRWEEADGGTIFLDGITETSLSFQVKLLRVLQERGIRRQGANQIRKVDVRVVAASNRDVEEEVNAGRFRNDLLFLLNTVSIRLPSLRERREDIPLLAQIFGDRVYSFGPKVRFSSEVLELMEQYPWSGNIRELESAVVRAAAMCDGMIRSKDLPERIRNYRHDPATGFAGRENEDWPVLSEIEGRYVARVLAHTRGNKQAASRVLGVDRKTLDRMIKRHHITVNKHSAASSLSTGAF